MKSATTAIRLMAKVLSCTALLICLYLFGSISNAQAQYQMDTLRTPLIIGAPSAPAYTAPPEGQPPPIGDGFAPPPVTPGHRGLSPEPVPSEVSGIPLVPAGEDGKAMVNSYVAPYLTPPTEFDPTDPGIIDSPQDFSSPPVTVTQINPGGGISGSAPIQRWGGQTTRDFGRAGSGSTCRDFGQKLSQKSDLFRSPQTSQDGPRQSVSGGGRASSLPGAQSTTDLHGSRTLFKGPRLRPRFTLADH